MARKYTKTETDKRGDSYTILRKGVKKVNIGNDVWTIGRRTTVDNKSHCVIYGPDNKQYSLSGNDVNKLYGSYCNRQGNTAIEKDVKIHILTSILDNINNWEFNLNKIPHVGKLKVILDNGTVKNIDFNGIFHPQEILSKRKTYKYRKTMWSEEYAHSCMYFEKIVGYRKN
jgi:hypothetical protein